MLAIDGVGFNWSDMAEEQLQSNMALMAFSDSKVLNDKTCSKSCLNNYETLKKKCDDLIIKLHKTKFKASTYKRGLTTVEEQLVTFRKNKVQFSEEIAVLKREVGCKEYQIGVLKTELNKIKQEKEGIVFKIENFDNASKCLDKMLESYITDKSKKVPEFNKYGPRDTMSESIIDCDKELDNSKENTDDSLEKDQVSNNESSPVESSLKCDRETIIDWKEIFFHPAEKGESVKPKNDEKSVKKTVRYAKMYRSQCPRGNQRNWNGQKSNQLGSEFVMYNKACYGCGSFDHIQFYCPNHQKKRRVTRNNYNKFDHDYYSKNSHPSSHRNMTPKAVLLKTGLKPFSTARSVYTAKPKSTVQSARLKTYFSKQAHSTIQRPFYNKTTLTNRYSNQNINTARPRVVNTARPNRAPVNAVKANGFNAVKPLACWVWRPIKPNGASLGKPQMNDKGFVNSGYSRHMTGNIAYLTDFKEFNGGYVTFGGGAYGGKITGKGTLKTDCLNFEDVHYVDVLKFNLFSVSQMCDKKNFVLFTDTECLVLSQNFKLPDENQILLRIPREDNMYSFNMKNIVPKESLTCLVANATSDESMLWHRRLGHINFKNINKLVKENFVRDLPLKRFENDQTCVACLKGKQHKASCKSKVLNPITKPLFMLHMDLFGLTFVSSLMHKKYCLVVTDDYSTYTWVFFLVTKDETSEILKNFIIQIENLVDQKVKIIRCDNGTKFKNKVMDTFCKEKEAVSTACYVQNRVLIVKPHNKTPYELFRGIKPALSFMKPFGYHVTILNTLDSLGKFDGKSDEGFFVGYSLSSKAFRVYNTRTKKVEENLHIGFLENKPMIERNGSKWLFDIDSLTQSMNYVPVIAGTSTNESAGTQRDQQEDQNAGTFLEKHRTSQDCIVMPIWKDASYFDSPSKQMGNKDPKSVFDDLKVHEDGSNDESNVNTASSGLNTGGIRINTIGSSVNTATSKDMVGPSHSLEATHDKSLHDADNTEADLGNILDSYTVPTTPHTRIHLNHPLTNVIGDILSPVQTRRMKELAFEQGFLSAVYEAKSHEDLHTCLFSCFLSQEEPKRISKALADPACIYQKVIELLVQNGFLENKKDERGIVIRNKARLVTQGHTQEEGIDHDEVFAPVARIEAIRLFLAYASFMGFMVYQMDVKNAFLYGQIEEEVYVCQPPGFEDPKYPDKVYRVMKALYGLHQAPRAWYETLANYLLDNKFHRGKIDQTLFIKRHKGDTLLVQIYVDDIIFGSTKKELLQQRKDGIFINQDKYVAKILSKFNYTDVKTASTPVDLERPLVKDGDAEDVDVHLYRSMIGSLMYLTSSRPYIMFAVCACARFQVTPKTSHLLAMKRIFRYLKSKPTLGLWYSRNSPFELVAYTDSDYAGATQDRKSTTGGCQFLGNKLISWQCKKQTIATSTTEAEYVAAASCCGQLQALVHKKKVIITEESIRRDLHFADEEGTDCLPNDTIFTELARIGAKTTAWNEFSSNMASAIICLANNQKFNFSKYILTNMVKNLEGGVKFFMFLRFLQVFLNKQVEGLHTHKETFVVSSHTKKIFANIRRQADRFSGVETPLFETMMVQANEEVDEDHVLTFSSDPLHSGEDNSDLNELMVFCLSLQEQVLALQQAKDAQAKEIANLKKTVKKLQRQRRSRPVGGNEDDFVQDEAQEQLYKEEMFGVDDIHGEEVTVGDTTAEVIVQDAAVEIVTTTETVTAAKEVTTASGPTTSIDELTLAQTLVEIAAKSKKVEAITTAATSVTTVDVTRHKAKGIVFHEDEQTHRPTVSSIPPSSKDKGKAIMIEPERPLERKQQVTTDEEYAKQLAESKKAMMEADRLLAERLQAREREELTIEEKSKLFVELMNKRRKHFADLRAQEKRNKTPTKSQKRNEQVKVEVDDTTELKRCLEVVYEDEDDVTIDATSLSSRSPSIVDYKIHKENFNIDDLEDLWKIVKSRFMKKDPVDDLDNLLLRTLNNLFEPQVEDTIWTYQQGLTKVKNWKLYDSCGVYCITMQNIVYYLLVEKTYPLTRNTLHQLWNDVKLQVDYEVEMAYELLRLIRKQLQEGYVAQ
ncbi:putative ribonuclease H-like domain-containing protein [Tanacetum coccineum]